MPDQTEAQLLHLVDRAERGTLLAEEAVLLRAGIRKLAAARRSAGGKEAEVRRLRQQRDTFCDRLDKLTEQAKRDARASRLATNEIVRLYGELADAKRAATTAQPARTA